MGNLEFNVNLIRLVPGTGVPARCWSNSAEARILSHMADRRVTRRPRQANWRAWRHRLPSAYIRF